LGARVDALRARWDPRMAARIESHITLIYEMTDIERIRTAAAASAPLRVVVTRAKRWLAGEPGIYLDVEDPYGDVAQFRRTVLGEDRPYAPHVTILHRESVQSAAQAEEAWAALKDARINAAFVIGELVVYEERDGRWHDAGRVRFLRR
jgi:2'-5' RNA ligase